MRPLPDRLAIDRSGASGVAAQWAANFVIETACCIGVTSFCEISQAHLVGAYHSGPANLALLDRLCSGDARVRVRTSLNSSSADLRDTCHIRYRGAAAEKAREVVRRLCSFGCEMTLSCAPYYIPAWRPERGDRLAWAESNAVLFANSVIGARTLKTPQFLDLAAALCGFLPETGELTDCGRQPQIRIDLNASARARLRDPIGYELLGFWIGQNCQERVVFVSGLDETPSEMELRALCAAAGVAGDTRLIHMEHVTPEAEIYATISEGADMPRKLVTGGDLWGLQIYWV